MNILFVSSEFPLSDSQATGGIGTYLLNLTSGLVKQGHRVTVVTRGRGVNKHKKIKVVFCDFGVNFIAFLKKIFRFSLGERLLNFIEYPLFFSFGAYLKINKIVKEQKIDIIEGNDFGGELFFYLLLTNKKPRVVIRLHTPSFVIQKFNDEPTSLFYRVMKFFETFCLKKSDSIYSPTRSLAAIVSKEIDRPIKDIIPYPFKPLKKPRIERKDNLILYVGKLQVKKGVFTLLKAIPFVLNRFPQVKFLFIGSDNLFRGKSTRDRLIRMSKKMRIDKSVEFKPLVAKNKLYKLYAQATITVLPSYWENFPNVLLEAASLGSPVICSNTGGLREIVKDKVSGLLTSPRNYHELSIKIINLLDKEKLRIKLADNAFKELKKFNPQKIARNTIDYFRIIF